eukprot:COSAG02_NODE_109_length_36250_cov_121.168903_13_plen_189_part_00
MGGAIRAQQPDARPAGRARVPARACVHPGGRRTSSQLLVLLSIMIVNELTVFASLTVRFLRGVCQVLRSAQRLTVPRPGLASARQRTPPLSRVASGGSPPPLRVGCAVLHWMASPAREGPTSAGPYPPDAVEPLLLELRGMDDDSRLASAGVGAAFAASFPSMPDEVFLSSLTAVQWSRVACTQVLCL